MHVTNALIMCMQKNGKKRNAKEQIPSTNMPDLLKTYGNWKKKNYREQNAKPRRLIYLDRK